MRGSGCRRRVGARLLLAGDDTFEDGLGIIHYYRLRDLLRVVYDEGGRARSRATVPVHMNRRLIYKEHTSTHAEGAHPRVWGLVRAGLRAA